MCAAEAEEKSLLVTGTSHPALAKEVADFLEIELSQVDLFKFPDKEIALQVMENVRGRDVFVLQTIALEPNDYLMELLILVDALKRASAKSINAVIPYFGYSRQDRKDRPRVPITAKLVANMLVTAGVDRVLTMELHADQIQGFFDIPVDNLYARPLLAEALKEMLDLDNCVCVAPDAGSVKLVRNYAAHLGVEECAVLDKQRLSAEQVEVVTVIGDVKGKDVLLADDMCSTAGTLVSAAKACREKGAKNIFVAITHGLFVGDAVDKIENSPIELLVTSNTIPYTDRLKGSSKIKHVSVASLFGKAINCINLKKSISSLYEIKCSL
ncbi:MAG: ribose-phosphate pyrophosphokinase [Chlamydiales bacterium]|nr:ribose-phosphate pyrophosphokinase [Chlamydiia bacterium]MCP5508310.1 ribose-phosphate pyrophosphokinase [Chlamydiales bacterium]